MAMLRLPSTRGASPKASGLDANLQFIPAVLQIIDRRLVGADQGATVPPVQEPTLHAPDLRLAEPLDWHGRYTQPHPDFPRAADHR